MKWKFLNVPLGVNAPSGILRKCDGWNTAASASVIGDVLNFAGNMWSNYNNEHQNTMNRRMVADENQKNRDWQSAENRAAEAWQEKMWQMQNEYNTPSAQRIRMQEAGFNPWISGSGGPQSLAGQAGQGHSGSAGMMGVPSPIAMQNPFNGMGNIAQALGIDAQIANQNAKTMMELIQVYDKARESGMSHDDAVTMISPMLTAVGGLSKELNITLENRRFDYELKKQQKEYLDELNPIVIDKTKEEKALIIQQFNESAARIGKMVSDAKVNEAQIDELVTRAARNLAEKYHLEQSADEILRCKRAIARKMYADAVIAENEMYESNAEFANREDYRKWLYSPTARQKRMMSEAESGNFNERVAKLKKYCDALGVHVGFDGSIRDNYSTSSSWFGENRNSYGTGTSHYDYSRTKQY